MPVALPLRIREHIDVFVSRAWLLPKLQTWLRDCNEPVFLITGLPGAGKSMLAAWLTGFGPAPTDSADAVHLAQLRAAIRAAHFCIAGASVAPQDVVGGLACRLTETLPDFGQALLASNGREVQITINQHAGSMSGSMTGLAVERLVPGDITPERTISLLLVDPLCKLYADGYDTQVVLLVDALDEAETASAGPKMAQLLSGLRHNPRLPRQVRILATTRPDPRVLAYFKTVPRESSLDLIDDAPGDADDIARYAQERLAGLDADRRIALTQKVAAAARGIFLYAHLVLKDLCAHPPASAEIETLELPHDLSDLYLQFLLREIGAEERWYATYYPVLGLIAVAHGEGLSRAQLQGIMGKSRPAIEPALRACAQYLAGSVPDGPFRPFHQSFAEFLLDDEHNTDRHIDAAEMHSLIAGYYLNKHGCAWDNCDAYGLRYVARHLIAAGRIEEMLDILTDPAFLEAKTDRIGLEELFVDLRTAASSAETVTYRTKYINLQDVLLMLHREGYKLARWNPEDTPGYFAQQYLYGAQRWAMGGILASARRWLQQKKAPWWSLDWIGDLAAKALVRALLTERASQTIVIPQRGYLVTQAMASIQFWDIKTGEPVYIITKHSRYLSPSSDGKHLVIGDQDSLELWNLETWQQECTLPIHDVRSVQFTPGDNYLLIFGDAAMQVWDTRSKSQARIFAGDYRWVEASSITPDGQYLLCQHSDGVAVVHLQNGEVTHFAKQPEQTITASAISPDGKYLVMGYADKLVTFSVETKEVVVEFVAREEEDFVTCIAFVPESALFMTGSQNGSIRIWDVAQGKLQFEFAIHTQPLERFLSSPTGRFLASISSSYCGWAFMTDEQGNRKLGRVIHTVQDIPSQTLIWDMHTLQPLLALAGQSSEAVTLVFTPDEKRLVIGYRSGVVLEWNLAVESVSAGLPAPVAEAHTKSFLSKLWSRWRRWRSHQQRQDGIRVYTRYPERKLAGHSGGVQWISMVPGTDYLISQGTDQTVKVWNLESAPNLDTNGHENKISQLALVSGGQRVVSASSDTTLKVWDRTKGVILYTLTGHVREILKLAVTSDGQYVLSASKDECVKVWNLLEGTCVHSFHGHNAIVTDVALSEDGGHAISVSLDGTIYVWEIVSGRIVHKINLPEQLPFSPVNSLVVMPGASYVIGIAAGGVAMAELLGITLNEDYLASPIIDLRTGKIVDHLPFLDSLRFTPDGRYAIGFVKNHLKALDLSAESPDFNTFAGPGHNGDISSVAIAPDAQWVVSSSEDGLIKVWNLEHMTLERTLVGHTDGVRVVQVSDDGTYLVSAGNDETIRAWHTGTWRQEAAVTVDSPPTCVQLVQDNGIDPVRCVAVVGDELGRVYCLQLLEPDTSTQI